MFSLFALLFIVPPIKTEIVMDKTETFSLEFLRQFPNYGLVLHFENNTARLIDAFMSLNYNWTVPRILLTYDVIGHTKLPPGEKYVHVIFQNIRFFLSRSIVSNFAYTDIVVFVTDEDFEDYRDNFWEQTGLNVMGRVFVYNYIQKEMKYLCYYCGDTKNVVLNRVPLDSYLPKYSKSWNDFKGHTFKVGYTPYKPTAYCRNKVDPSDECIIEGPEGELLTTLSKYLNFRYSMVSFEDRPEGEWNAMMQSVYTREIDFAISGISVTLERRSYVDFTSYIIDEAYVALYAYVNKPWHMWHRTLSPLQLSVWLCLAGTIIVMGAVIKYIAKVLQETGFIELGEFIKISYHAFMGQPLLTLNAKSTSMKFMLIMLWCLALILTTAYRSKLASSLIQPDDTEPNGLLDLFGSGYTFAVDERDVSVIQERFEFSLDTIYKEALNLTSGFDICSSILKSLSTKIAVLHEETPFVYLVFSMCNGTLSREDISKLRIARYPLFTSKWAWAFQIGTPFLQKFSTIILQLQATGIIRHWYQVTRSGHVPTSNERSKIAGTRDALTLSTFFAPALVFIVGCVISLLVFILEIIYFRFFK